MTLSSEVRTRPTNSLKRRLSFSSGKLLSAEALPIRASSSDVTVAVHASGQAPQHARRAGVSALALGIGLTTLSLGFLPGTAQADIANFQLDGKIYNKYVSANDGSQGCVWLGNPAWPDNFTGSNGACSEFELGIRANVSKYVKAGVRLQSRWGATWQDWWENGDEKDNINDSVGDSSGESLGLNHAQYMKLRGFWIEAAPPLKTVKSVKVGASDLGMFSPWTIGKIRYIDRDNARGVFVRGAFDKIPLEYEGASIAMPKLFAGPSWNLGNGDPVVGTNAYITQDWAYALKLTSRPSPNIGLRAIGVFTNDQEFNPIDPDTPGTLNPYGQKDGAIDLTSRYRSANATFEVDANPFDWLTVNALGAYSWSDINPDFALNGVTDSLGFTPVIYAHNVNSLAAKVRADATDPFGMGLSFSAEYFNIGADYNAILGSRREADVLLTDGFLEGGQIPTLNIANEFMDWDEAWYESAIGWKGFTLVGTQTFDVSQLRGEVTLLGYNTNGQNWDVDTVYPSFLYGDGYTDTDLFDYANVGDRGRDPRAVFHRFQDRSTVIGALWYDTAFDVGNGLDLKLKGKFIHDGDTRDATLENDTYKGNLLTLRAKASYQVSNEMKAFVGDEINHWREFNRSPLIDDNPGVGYYDYLSRKNKLFGGFEYNFAGMKLTYLAEWVVKDANRADDLEALSGFNPLDIIPRPFSSPDAYQVWNRIRTKATLEAAW